MMPAEADARDADALGINLGARARMALARRVSMTVWRRGARMWRSPAREVSGDSRLAGGARCRRASEVSAATPRAGERAGHHARENGAAIENVEHDGDGKPGPWHFWEGKARRARVFSTKGVFIGGILDLERQEVAVGLGGSIV